MTCRSEPRPAPAERADCLAGRIQGWLMSSGIQIRQGEHAGAVCGWLDEQGRTDFFYPEAAGYFLTFCAFLAEADREMAAAIRPRADLTVRWLAGLLDRDRPPPSRLYVLDGQADWRARTVFSFDLAMVFRGLQTARTLTAGSACGTALGALSALLAGFCQESGLVPCRPVQNAFPVIIPDRWSTRRGAYQQKAISALRLSGLFSFTREAAHPAERTGQAMLPEIPGTFPSGLLHPDFYFMEGLALSAIAGRDSRLWNRADEAYRERMVLLSEKGAGGIASAGEENRRSDVLAQALRLGCLLRSKGFLKEREWGHRLAFVAQQLACMVDPNGAVRFAPEESGRPAHWNSWCAMFACQAFRYYAQSLSGREIPAGWMERLV